MGPPGMMLGPDMMGLPGPGALGMGMPGDDLMLPPSRDRWLAELPCIQRRVGFVLRERFHGDEFKKGSARYGTVLDSPVLCR